MSLPSLFRVRQSYPPTAPLDVRAVLRAEFEKLVPRLRPRMRIAVAVGSRGITNLSAIVGHTLEVLREARVEPFLLPAMGSHGGATAEGQREVLATYGVTEASMGVSIRAGMEVRQIGVSSDGVPVWCSVEALGADGIILINRIKPHTDFAGAFGSGLLKMSVIGLGKKTGAATMHAAAAWLGYERCIRGLARTVLDAAPILGGVAILEDQRHDTAKLRVLPVEEIEKGEEALFVEASQRMPRLPFEEIDLLIVDRLGKNISGSGMDPNVTGRWVHGYSCSLLREDRPAPFIRRIFVRDLTPETHGNASGIGLADLTTTRLVRAMDCRTTYVNALTALSMQSAKIPIHFDTDREAFEMALASLALADLGTARIVRIADTLSLGELEVSEALRPAVERNPALTVLSAPGEWRFDGEGNLPPISEL